jgi:hypothetical protein
VLSFDRDVAPVLARATGRTPVSARPVDEGAYSPAGRWVVTWADGGSSFVKAEDGDHGLVREHLVLSSVTAPWLPRFEAYDAGPPRVLVTEDLSHARWDTPVTAEDADAFAAACDALEGVPAPDGIAPMYGAVPWPSAEEVAATGLADASWLSRHLATLADAASRADTSGDRLVHGDVWMQNWCRVPGRGVVVVDWAAGHAGNLDPMRATGEVAVRAAGGPHGHVMAGRPEWAAWVAGHTVAWLAEDDGSMARLTETLRREAVAAIGWACDELGLPAPAAAFTLGPWRP